jgi:hypothetical protein
METRVAECHEAERAAMPREPVPSREAAERSDGKRQREKPECPQSGLNLELFDGIRAEIIGEGATCQPGNREETDEDERNGREAPDV